MLQTGAQVADQAVQGILSRIDVLAQKLGTTASAIWNIYVAQARIEAIRDTAIGVGFIFLSALLFVFRQTLDEEDARAFAFLVALGVLVSSAFWFYPALGEWLNPQYWAFTHLTLDLKNLL